MKYAEELSFIKKTIEGIIKKYGNQRPDSIQQKTEFDLVTEIDISIEQDIIRAITEEYPSDNFVSEEFNSKNSLAGRCWIIDPIDGTCNFSNGIPLYGIQCALAVDEVIVMSYIYLNHLNEEYYAILEEGAYMNGKRIELPQDRPINHAIMSIGDFSHSNQALAKLQYGFLEKMYPKVAKIRMFGAACIDFSYAACGKTDGCVILTNNIWDIAPGILLCKESGCIVTNIKGGEHHFSDNGVLVASTKELHRLMVEAFI